MTYPRDDAERGGDIIDQASAAVEIFLEASLSKHRDATAPEQHPDFDGENCVGCELPIPGQRLALGRVRCVPCQELIERERKQYAKTPL